MIYNEDTYYIGYHRNVRAMGAVTSLVFDTIAGMVANSDGVISNDAIAELLGVTEKYVREQIKRLCDMGYIDKLAGNGRGKKTTYVLTEKGEQNAPLYVQKGGTKRPLKGEQNAPLSQRKEPKENNNKVINKVLIKKENFSMEDFLKFWNLFRVDPEHELERDRCENKWRHMEEDQRQSVIRELEDGRRNNSTKSPYVYLFNYKEPLRYIRQGTVGFEKWRTENLAAEKRMCLIKFDGRIANCLAEDLPKLIEAGAELINGDWK